MTELNTGVKDTQDNVIKIHREISKWEEKPLFMREASHEGEGEQLIDLTKTQEVLLARSLDSTVEWAIITSFVV